MSPGFKSVGGWKQENSSFLVVLVSESTKMYWVFGPCVAWSRRHLKFLDAFGPKLGFTPLMCLQADTCLKPIDRNFSRLHFSRECETWADEFNINTNTSNIAGNSKPICSLVHGINRRRDLVECPSLVLPDHCSLHEDLEAGKAHDLTLVLS